MQGRGNEAVEKRRSLDVISVRRNPYLVEYEEQKQLRRAVNGSGRSSGAAARERSRRSAEIIGERSRRPSGHAEERNRRSVEIIGEKSYRPSEYAGERNRRPVEITGERGRRPSGASGQRSGGMAVGRNSQFHSAPVRRGQDPAAAKRAARERKKKQQRRRRMMACACLLCLLMTGLLILVKTKDAFAAEPADNRTEISDMEKKEEEGSSSTVIQGLSSEVYAKHPAWEEDFLPLNYYSRPGDALPEVKDIFVHYTANPGTSAAQNRSYFEQQKDVHEASVSAHFIIGYEGEIIQCVPLDEIAYAVQTRNYDSVSIECCYKAEDGSFTQETYDSLISLLAWLTEAYGLDTDHILRHYDCGGKKCPLYYTEHEDAWVRLKEDVERSSAL